MNTWSKVEELVDFVRTHDIKELKDYWSHKRRKTGKIILFYGYWQLLVQLQQ